MAKINGNDILFSPQVNFIGEGGGGDGSITVDPHYSPESENAQSGKAVAQAVKGVEEQIPLVLPYIFKWGKDEPITQGQTNTVAAKYFNRIPKPRTEEYEGDHFFGYFYIESKENGEITHKDYHVSAKVIDVPKNVQPDNAITFEVLEAVQFIPTVDQTYQPTSTNPQSGKAVAQALGKLSLGLHTDGLLYIFVDGKPFGEGIALQGGTIGDVIGTLDENNNILLSGELADGTYTLKYENADGTYTEIGSLVVAEAPEAPDNGLAVPTDSTAQADWDAGKWCNESYIGGSSYSYRAAAGTSRVTTNTFAVENGDTIYVKGINYSTADTSMQLQVAMFNADGEYIYHSKIDTVANNKYITDVVGTEGEDYFSFKNCGMNGYDWGTRIIRFAGWLSGTAYDVIITRNEPIE